MSRIIAGSAKGRRLTVPPHRLTRPTTDRVREAAFNLIADWAGTAGCPAGQSLAGLSFLDLYAGSGAVALEAASRGAEPVWAVERDRGTAEVARRNVGDTGLGVAVLTRRVAALLATSPPQFGPGVPGAGETPGFDVVWADPPYDLAAAELDSVLAALVTRRWLANRGLVAVERSSRESGPEWPQGMEDSWRRDYGDTTLYFAMRGSE